MIFSEIPVGQKFSYDGEMFIKTQTGEMFVPPRPEGGIAWSVKASGDKIKEWAFNGDEKVLVKNK